MQDVKFVVIDEYSMVGCGMLGMIDRRLRQATGKIDAQFGGLYVYLFGDINQLPPVLDKPLYTNETPECRLQLNGKIVFNNFDKAVILDQVHRQGDMTFKKVLTNISMGRVSENDYNILKTRFIQNFASDYKAKFKDSVNLFPTKDKVNALNLASLRNLKTSNKDNVPLAVINAKHNNEEASKQDSNKAGGLSKTLYLGPGCNIMLRANLWTEKGLVNGTLGHVVDVVYAANEKPPNCMPAFLMCHFPLYSGPSLGQDPNVKLVPIPVQTRAWTSPEGKTCTRTQFPVHPAYAVTIHKSQGLTLSQAIIDIGEDREMSPGISFVALSRLKSLDGLLLYPFSLKRFLKINTSSVLHLKATALENMRKKLLTLNTDDAV